MDLGLIPVITGFVVVTTAIFGFSQYFYNRIVDKDNKLLDKLKYCASIQSMLQIQDNPYDSASCYQDYLLTTNKNIIKNLYKYENNIENNQQKKTFIRIIYILPAPYFFYVAFYGIILSTPTPHDFIVSALTTISIILPALMAIILYLAKGINIRQINLKKDIKNTTTQLEELEDEWNVFKAEFIIELNKKNSQKIPIDKREKLVKLRKVIDSLPEEILTEIAHIFSKNKDT